MTRERSDQEERRDAARVRFQARAGWWALAAGTLVLLGQGARLGELRPLVIIAVVAGVAALNATSVSVVIRARREGVSWRALSPLLVALGLRGVATVGWAVAFA